MQSRKIPKSAWYNLMHLDVKYSKLHPKRILLLLLLNFQSTFRLKLMCAGPIPESVGMSPFFGAHCLDKRAFWLLAPLKCMPFLTISDKNIFCKTQGARSSAIVAPNKSLEQTLCVYDSVKILLKKCSESSKMQVLI